MRELPNIYSYKPYLIGMIMLVVALFLVGRFAFDFAVIELQQISIEVSVESDDKQDDFLDTEFGACSHHSCQSPTINFAVTRGLVGFWHQFSVQPVFSSQTERSPPVFIS